MLGEVVAAARAAGIARLIGHYRPTPKNGMVRDHYATLGFRLVDETPDGERRFELDVAAFEAPALPIAAE
jgi:predicted enzyme involved in methoxymalonyl-ACP biosynthesis